jgi:hypothetical protein
VERGDLVHGPCGDVRCVEQTLILTVGGTATTANSEVVVTIELDNSATAQAAVTPTVRPVSGGSVGSEIEWFALEGGLRPSTLSGCGVAGGRDGGRGDHEHLDDIPGRRPPGCDGR